jgi:subtilisin family serine protease
MKSRHLRVLGCSLVLALVAVATGWPTSAVAATGPNDPYFKQQWGLRRIGAPAAWKTTQGAGITIAVVDTGIDKRHEDLAGNFLTAKQYDAINDDFDAADLHGHGTSVAGVSAAVTNNRKGVAGTAPKAKIMAIRAFGALEGANPADVADGVMWAADNGAKVINLSLGAAIPVDPFVTDLQELSLIYAAAQGALVVAAAGNASQPFCSTPAFNPAVLCVGASDELDRLADFSNYFLRLDVVAPGTSIITTDKFGLYSATQGTSVASPYVAGVGALLMSMGATNFQAAQIIRASAKDLGLPGYDNTYGFGRLDAKGAVDLCKQVC